VGTPLVILFACHAAGASVVSPAREPHAPTAVRAQTGDQRVEQAPSQALSSSPIDAAAAPHNLSASPKCRKTLSAFCRGDACPTFDAARAEAATTAVSYDPTSCVGLCSGDVRVGTCGGLRVVENGDCLCGQALYFDDRGTLVGAAVWTDVLPCQNRAYGRVPACP
jgi:hypothetical protein